MLELEAEFLQIISAVEAQAQVHPNGCAFMKCNTDPDLKEVARDLFNSADLSVTPEAFSATIPMTVFSKRCAVAHVQYLCEEAEGLSSCSDSSSCAGASEASKGGDQNSIPWLSVSEACEDGCPALQGVQQAEANAQRAIAALEAMLARHQVES